jgi:hypothetical protein
VVIRLTDQADSTRGAENSRYPRGSRTREPYNQDPGHSHDRNGSILTMRDEAGENRRLLVGYDCVEAARM